VRRPIGTATTDTGLACARAWCAARHEEDEDASMMQEGALRGLSEEPGIDCHEQREDAALSLERAQLQLLFRLT
jgi:hypothetical protein